MKRLIKILGILVVSVPALNAASVSSQLGLVKSHTFFTLRPNFTSASPERVSLFRNNLMDECACGWGGALEVVFYGGRFTQLGSEKLARFFLPSSCHLCCLNVREFNPNTDPLLPLGTAQSQDYDRAKDLEARNFNIVTVAATSTTPKPTFAGKVCFNPFQEKFGVGFCYKQALNYKCDGSAGWWLEVSLPVERVKNKIELKEVVTSSGGGPDLNNIGLDNSPHVANMIQAFAQPNWQYGKIDCRCRMERWGIADVELKLGYNTITTDHCFMNSYIGLLLPAGNRVHGRYVFEPIVGHNHHFAVMLGTSIGFAIWNWRSFDAAVYFDANANYFSSNHQVRSFDLVDKQWSRYQEVYSRPEQAAAAFAQGNFSSGTSGINVFTQCFRVWPHLDSTFNTALTVNRYDACGAIQIELGYNFYVRQTETLELACCDPIRGVALKGIDGDGSTTLARNIKQNFRDSFVAFNNGYIRVSECDIDLQSAAQPATISHTVYGVIGYKWDRACPCFASIGGSWEFNSHQTVNTAPERWLVWGKIGFAF